MRESPLVHFIFGLSDKASQRHFGFAQFLAIRAASIHLRPSPIWFHCHYVPTGVWWEYALPLLVVKHVEMPRSRSSARLSHAAHRADVLRLQLLIAHGGIYLDLDVIVLRPFHTLTSYEFVMGKEGDAAHGGSHGLCNAVLLARPNASFARRWLAEYKTFGEGTGDRWSEHSVQLPSRLAASFPSEVTVLGYLAFFWPDWHERELRQLLLDGHSSALSHLLPPPLLPPLERGEGEGPPHTRGKGFAVHLWNSLSSRYVLSQWSPEYILSVPSGLNCLMQVHTSHTPSFLRCWRNATALSPFPGRSVLAFSPPFEAFVPLHAASMRQERGWSVSWCCPLHEPRALAPVIQPARNSCEQPAT
ncbi:MAG: hypothetical protein SGPRY_002069, partial [Prymnesium sp.]